MGGPRVDNAASSGHIVLMNTAISMRERFGSFLADGDVANQFRFTEIEPAVSAGTHVILDFEGVTNMTDSFGNAFFGPLFVHHPELHERGIEFKNCTPTMQTLISLAIQVGEYFARRERVA